MGKRLPRKKPILDGEGNGKKRAYIYNIHYIWISRSIKGHVGGGDKEFGHRWKMDTYERVKGVCEWLERCIKQEYGIGNEKFYCIITSCEFLRRENMKGQFYTKNPTP